MSVIKVISHCINTVVGIILQNRILLLVVGTAGPAFPFLRAERGCQSIENTVVETEDSTCPEAFKVGESI